MPLFKAQSVAGAYADYLGAWNATTNTPTLVSGVGVKGALYKVSVAGVTTLDGISIWNVGDDVAFDGTVWNRLAGGSIQAAQINDSTTAGRALLTAANVAAQLTALGLSAVIAASVAINAVWAGPASGGAGAPAFRALVLADLPGSIPASKLVGSDIATVGTITSGTWNSTLISGQYGGTGVANTGFTWTLAGSSAIPLITSPAAATFQFGAADAASPIAQVVQFQSVVAGNANTAGAIATIKTSLGTGTAASATLVIQTSFSNINTNFTCTISNASPAVITAAAHGLVPGSVGQFTTTGTLPAGLSLATNYYVIATSLASGSFQVSATPGGAAINTTNAGSGTHTFTTQTSQQNPAATLATWGPSALTGSQTTPALLIQQVWNTSGSPTALKISITNIASTSFSSPLINCLAGTGGATSVFSVDVTGSVACANQIIASQGFGIGNSNTTLTQGTGNALNIKAAGAICIFSAPTNASWQLGAPDIDTNAAVVAQIMRTQGAVAGGTSNQAGKDFTFIVSPGKGTGAGGQFIIQTCPAGSTGTAVNAAATGLMVTAPAVNMQPSVVCGNQALATTATDGFLYIAGGAGPPTGVPTAFTGRYPLYWNTTNKKMYLYDGSWLGGTAPGVWS